MSQFLYFLTNVVFLNYVINTSYVLVFWYLDFKMVQKILLLAQRSIFNIPPNNSKDEVITHVYLFYHFEQLIKNYLVVLPKHQLLEKYLLKLAMRQPHHQLLIIYHLGKNKGQYFLTLLFSYKNIEKSIVIQLLHRHQQVHNSK